MEQMCTIAVIYSRSRNRYDRGNASFIMLSACINQCEIYERDQRNAIDARVTSRLHESIYQSERFQTSLQRNTLLVDTVSIDIKTNI